MREFLRGAPILAVVASYSVTEAGPADFDEIAQLVNAAYRSGEGWTHEAGLVDGPRTSRADLEREVAGAEPAIILGLRGAEAGPIVACVLLRRKGGHFYLGMLSVMPQAMDRGLGRALLDHSEAYARDRQADRVVMTVLNVRNTLIAWYERRGYRRTGESIPFPYENEGLGKPRLKDLSFVVLEKLLK
jgi:ribosomal protein S18 acetylase RimI-like enzyme